MTSKIPHSASIEYFIYTISIIMPSKMRVLIVGGGIAGLTLANMLEKFGIDYLLFEAHGDIAPAVGASIGLFPNGLRILDQLGCYDRIMLLPQQPIRIWHSRNARGESQHCLHETHDIGIRREVQRCLEPYT